MSKVKNDLNVPDLKESLTKDWFRILIWGSSGSGKSYLLTEKLLPIVKNIYDDYIVFTREVNENYFLRAFRKHVPKKIPHIFTNVSDILETLLELKKIQKENTDKDDKNGEPIYNSNMMIIFDDIVNEKLFKDPQFLEVFFNFRHLQISTVLLTQITNKALNSEIKSNATHVFLFRLNNVNQRREPLLAIEGAIGREEPELSDQKIKIRAKKLYIDKVVRKPYGYIVVDQFSNMWV